MQAVRVVIIGGGVAGCSIAYHLAKLGCPDTVVLDRGELTGGSTFHSAGLVGQLRSSVALTRINMASVELYAGLARETGHDPGWRQVGSRPAVALGGEPIMDGEHSIGRVRSGGYRYAVQLRHRLRLCANGTGETGTLLTVELFGEAITAEVRAEPPYDPRRERLRA